LAAREVGVDRDLEATGETVEELMAARVQGAIREF
jgi:hypothetical protein